MKSEKLCSKNAGWKCLVLAGNKGAKLLIAMALSIPLSLGTVSASTDSGIGDRYHVVKRGDTLYKLSRLYQVSIAELKKDNRLRSDNILVGQKLALPSLQNSSPLSDSETKQPGGEGETESIHIVRRGDTLFGIAKRYRVPVSDLKSWNGLKSSLIRPGQRVRVARGEAKEPAPAAPAQVPTDKGVVELTRDENDKKVEDHSSLWASMGLEDRVRMQIFLDQSLFTPGKIDGATGTYTERAVQCWGRSQGWMAEESRKKALAIATDAGSPAFRTWTVRESDQEYVGRVASTVAGRSQQTRLPYGSMGELVAERFHTDLRALTRWNPGRDLFALKPGDRVQVPAVTPFRIESVLPIKPGAGGDWIADSLVIVWPEKILEVRDASDRLRASFPVTLGGKSHHVRSGNWEIGNYVPNPSFQWDSSMLKFGRPGNVRYLLPPGPNNPVGVVWMGLCPSSSKRNAHIGIHGTNQPETIGRAVSSGCIRLANWDAVRLAKHVRIGTRVRWEK